MLFVLSKVIYTLIAPSTFCLVLMGIGLTMVWRQRWRRAGRWLLLIGFAMFLVVGYSPLGPLISRPLEDRFAAAEQPAADVISHIIVLGGAEQAHIAQGRGRLGINASGERLLVLPELARRYPQAKVVFSGGYGWISGDEITAGKAIADYLIASGVPGERIVLEERSKNTWQNALFVKELLNRQKTACPCGYLLVTSAWHMPRAMGVFRQAGFATGPSQLFAWPVDFRTVGARGNDWRLYRNVHEGQRQTDLAVKEWLGLLAYWFLGRTSALWPGPDKKMRQE